MAFLTPILWTYRSYQAKKALTMYNFEPIDLALDSCFFIGLFQMIIMGAYILNSEDSEEPKVSMSGFLESQAVSFLFLTGTILYLSALKVGPGGPIEALIATNMIYRVVVNVADQKYSFGSYETALLVFGLIAVLCMTVGDSIVNWIKHGSTAALKEEDTKK